MPNASTRPIPDAATLLTCRLVVVGSLNPVKVAAARAVLARCAPDAVVEGVAVASTVRDQPVGDEETIRGATARADGARRARDAELGVGFEGGVVELPDGTMRTCAWAAVVAADGRRGVGGSLAMPIPPLLARWVREGLELGDAMDRLVRERGTKHGQGAVGILTAGLIDRQRAYETILTYALAPWLGGEYWS